MIVVIIGLQICRHRHSNVKYGISSDSDIKMSVRISVVQTIEIKKNPLKFKKNRKNSKDLENIIKTVVIPQSS